MANLDSDYPTDKQMENLFEAHKQGGAKAIEEMLNRIHPPQQQQKADRDKEERLPEYPTEQQMREAYEAYKSGRPGAIAEVLRKRKQEREESEGCMEEQRGTESVRRRVNLSSILSGLVVGLILGVAIGYSLPARFEKTTNMNVRFDTRTKQNCWSGWDVVKANPFDALDKTNPYAEFGGKPIPSGNIIPLCKDL